MKKKIVFSFLIGALFVWLSVRGVKWNEVAETYRSVNWKPLIGLPFLFAISHLFRSRRWRLFLKPLKDIRVSDLFMINAVGFLFIHIFPLRLGEAVRPFLLKRSHGVPFSSGFATIVIERIFDGLVTALILGIGVFTLSKEQQESEMLRMGVQGMAWISFGIFFSALVFLFIAFFQRERALRLVTWSTAILPASWREKIVAMAGAFIEGLRSLPNLRSLFLILLESVGVWVVMIFSFWLIFRAFHLSLPWGSSFTVLGVTTVGMMLPAAPASVGTYHYFLQAGLALYGVVKSVQLAVSVFTHLASVLYVALAGFLCFPAVSISMDELISKVQEQQKTESS